MTERKRVLIRDPNELGIDPSPKFKKAVVIGGEGDELNLLIEDTGKIYKVSGNDFVLGRCKYL